MDLLLHQLLESAARCHPDRIAVVDRSRSMTYADLESRANALAHLLMDCGVRRGDRVGLYLEKSAESLVAIYATLKAGAAYVPFDPSAPVARLAYIAGNCGIRVVLTSLEKSDRWKELVSGNGGAVETLVILDGTAAEATTSVPARVKHLGTEALAGRPTSPPSVTTISLDLAYILYTSGSTGDPKGVMLTHQNAMAFVLWAAEEFRVGPEDRLSSHAPLHFDLSVFDLFAAACVAAAVVLVPAETSIFPAGVARFIEEKKITVWYSVPSILTMLTLRGGLKEGALPNLRTVLFAGEVFPTPYLRQLMGLLPHVRFANLYGPTETNVCTWYDVPPIGPAEVDPIPIGKAIDGVEVFAVTEEGHLAAPDEVGELYVRGPTVMQGYWGDAERTARGLVSNPLDGTLTDKAYRTGDLVREEADGTFRFLGRRDSQIKSRGYRIELGEIETALYAHPSVVECAVTAVPDEVVTNRIKAFVVTRDPLTAAELIRFCADRIPRYMIPEAFEFLDALPKTSTGKVDKKSLALSAPAAS